MTAVTGGAVLGGLAGVVVTSVSAVGPGSTWVDSQDRKLPTAFEAEKAPKNRPEFLASRENPAIYRAISHGNLAEEAVRWHPGH